MQRAINGDCVAWKPEIAPHATVINIKLHIGVALGCIFLKLVQISGIVYSGFVKIPNATPSAMMIRQIPKIGYILPMILSMEMNVAIK